MRRKSDSEAGVAAQQRAYVVKSPVFEAPPLLLGFPVTTKRNFSFGFFNATQFLGVLNDQTYKLALIFFLVDLQGVAHSPQILFWSSVAFVIPFLLFTAPGGFLADRYRKQQITVCLKVFEVCIMTLGLIAFCMGSVWGGYTVLFLLATHSAFFGPSKYGIIPELVSPEKVSRANGIITGGTYLAIILGSFLAGRVAEWSGRNPIVFGSVCLGIAVSGFLCSLGIGKTPIGTAQGKMNWFVFYEIYKTVKRSFGRRFLFAAIFASAYFLFVGAFVQLNIIPFAINSLGLEDVGGVNLFLLTALGVGLGSFLAGRLSKGFIELGIVPVAALGIALCCFLLDSFSVHLYVVSVLMFVIGVFGGLYVVPVDTFIQVGSPRMFRAENIAAANFLGFVGVLLASGLLVVNAKVVGITPAEGFTLFGAITVGMAIVLASAYSPHLIRLLARVWLRRYQVVIEGGELIALSPDLGALCQVSCDKWWHLGFLADRWPYVMQIATRKKVFLTFLRGLYVMAKIAPEIELCKVAIERSCHLVVLTPQKSRHPWVNLPIFFISIVEKEGVVTLSISRNI